MRFRAACIFILLGASSVFAADRPERIVTLAPSLGELAAEILGDELDRIVGVSEYTDFPPKLARKPSIGPYHRINLEAVAALKPDLVLATTGGNAKEQVDRLRSLGIRTVVVATDNFAQVEASMREVGAALGLRERGEKTARAFRSGLERFRARSAGRTTPGRRVLVQLGDKPLVVAGGGNFLNDMIAISGAKNIYADSKSGYPRPSVEDVIQRNPDLILVMALGEDLEQFNQMAASWKRFGKTATVVRADAALRPSLRLLEGLTAIDQAIHGGS